MCDGPGLELEGGRMEDRGRCSDLASERTMAPDLNLGRDLERMCRLSVSLNSDPGDTPFLLSLFTCTVGYDVADTAKDQNDPSIAGSRGSIVFTSNASTRRYQIISQTEKGNNKVRGMPVIHNFIVLSNTYIVAQHTSQKNYSLVKYCRPRLKQIYDCQN